MASLRPPPIGEYTPTVPVEEGLRRVIPEQRGINVGSGLSELGGAVQKVAISDAANFTMNAASQARLQWSDQFRQATEQAGPGAPNFTAGIEKQYGQYVAQTLKDAPSDLARRMLQPHLNSLGGELMSQATQFEASAREKHSNDSGELMIQTASSDLLNNPQNFEGHLTENAALINALALRPQNKDALLMRNATELARNATLGSIAQDPYNAQLELIHPTKSYTAMLPPEMREQLLGKADEAIRSRLIQSEQLDRITKQQTAAQQDGIIKQGLMLSENGQLTTGFINQHSDLLTHEQMKFLLDEARGKQEHTQSDLHTYADLYTRASNGEDVRDDAQQDLFNGRLSKQDFTRISEISKKPPEWFKRGDQFIRDALKVDQMNPDPARSTSLANARNDWADWRASHPQATPEDAEKEYTSISDRYQIIAANQSMLTLPVPRYFVGSRTKPDIAASQALLRQKLQTGEISQDDAGKQALLLERWQRDVDALNKRTAKANP